MKRGVVGGGKGGRGGVRGEEETFRGYIKLFLGINDGMQASVVN